MFDVSGNYGSDGTRSGIANVTTNHVLRRRTRFGPVPVVLDLEGLADIYRGVFGFSYNPRRNMPAVKLNVQCEPYFKKMNVALYASGSVVQTGCQSPEQARLAAHIFARALRRAGLDLVVTDFRIDNIVATVNVAEPAVDLAAVKRHLGARCTYAKNEVHRATYPAAIIRSAVNPRDSNNPRGENIKILMYNTAHAVMMGVTSRESIVRVIDEIVEVVAAAKKLEGAVVAVRGQGQLDGNAARQETIRRANAAIRLRLGEAPPDPH